MTITRVACVALLLFLLLTGCALKPIAVTGKEGPTTNGSQAETLILRQQGGRRGDCLPWGRLEPA